LTQSELKEKLYKLVSVYFSAANGATVVWGMTKTVSPNAPKITLTALDIVRPYQPITHNKNGIQVSYYPSTTKIQVDLFTKGALPPKEEGIKASAENTALNDMIDFVNFINSQYVIQWSDINDISVFAKEVYDLTDIINDTTWDFRAMVELDIGFTQAAIGHSGINYENRILFDENGDPLPGAFEITSSGGRTQELADEFTGWFEQVEGPELKEKEK